MTHPTLRTPGRSTSTRTLAALLALAALATATGERTARAADPKPVDVENVRVGFEERYKTGSWTPVWVQLRGGLEGFAGVMEVLAPDEDGTTTRMSVPVQVGAGASQRVTAYVRVGSIDQDFAALRFVDGKTGRRAINDITIGTLMSARPPIPLDQEDYQVVRLGRPQGVELIPSLQGFNASRNNPAFSGRAREVAVANLAAGDDLLPGRWYGYDAVDVVALDTNDKEMLAALNAGKGEALRQWVERGGHLVVSVSSNWQAVKESMLAPMLPLRLGGQSTVAPFDSLESYTGASQQQNFENVSIQVARFEDVEARGGKVIASTLSTPLVVRGAYGFGRVTVVGLDTDAPPFSSWPDRTLFWVKALALKGSNVGVEGGQQAKQLFIGNNRSDMSTLIRQALDQFSGVTPIPFAWVAGFIFLYILLVGPGDYFLVKKVLKRMELTWITFPTIVVAVSLLAYYAAYYVKGTELRVNKMDVVDVDLDARLTRGTTWVNVFSPQNRDYSVEIAPLAADRVVPTDPDAVAPRTPGTETLLTWFAAPENGIRGMNGRNRGMGFGNSGYSYAPMGQAESLKDARIGIWSTKGFLGRWFGPAPAASSILDVNLQPVGTDRLAGTITNKLDYPLREAIVVYGKQVYYNLGTIEAGATIEIDRFLDRSLASHLFEKRGSYMPANLYASDPDNIARDELLREMMFHDIESSGQETLPSRTHHELDLSGLLPLGRPMLVASVDRPGAQLVLGNKPGAAKIEQTTVLRVIMPLKREAGPKPK